MAAAGSFAALSTIFGSPLIGAIIIIEAAGLGGPTLPVVLLPGLIAAGIGSLIFIGMGSLTGLSSTAYAIAPLHLPAYPDPTFGDFIWTIALSVVAAIVAYVIMETGRRTKDVVKPRPFVWVPVAAVIVAGLAIVFGQITGEPANLVLFSGQDAMGQIVNQAATLSLGTFALLILFKGLAWGLSLGSARGGPTFPAIFLGIIGGLLAAHLPGFAETPAVAVLVGAMCVSVLRLPLSAIVIALVVSQAGAGVAPLVIVGVAVAYIVSSLLSVREPLPPVRRRAATHAA
jgi:H+/Cl- antiporter ClcA